MLEAIINPKRAEREPWQMVFIGFLYASLSVFIARYLFGKDPVLSQYLGLFIIIFCVVLSMPFIYYTIKLEERKDKEYEDETRLLKEHGRAIMVFLWLFLGYILAFSIWYIVLPNSQNMFKAQIETFCQINRPDNINGCLAQYGIIKAEAITGAITARDKVFAIFANNVYVLILTLVLSLAFGAGAIFILAWNASVIAAAIGIFTKSHISQLPLGLGRYMIHGFPEIAAYFIAALAGGILSEAIIKRETKSDKFWNIFQDSLYLIMIALIILAISALIEVFITPKLF